MIQYGLLAFGSLFAIVDPLAAIPAFLAMTARASVEQRRRMALVACATCGLVLAVFAAVGPFVFRILSITMPAFQVAGGLIVLLTALDMLRAQRSPLRETTEETEAGSAKDDIAITPLAIPMLSGPGSITTAIVLAHKAQTWPSRVIFYASIAAVAAASYAVLYGAARGAKSLSPIAMNIMARLMGLLLAAVGIQFILSALKLSFA